MLGASSAGSLTIESIIRRGQMGRYPSPVLPPGWASGGGKAPLRALSSFEPTPARSLTRSHTRLPSRPLARPSHRAPRSDQRLDPVAACRSTGCSRTDLTRLHQGASPIRRPAFRRATARIALCCLSSSTISRTASYSVRGIRTYAALVRGSTTCGGWASVESRACCCCSVKRMAMAHYPSQGWLRSAEKVGSLEHSSPVGAPCGSGYSRWRAAGFS
jgi:hypothetical protein